MIKLKPLAFLFSKNLHKMKALKELKPIIQAQKQAKRIQLQQLQKKQKQQGLSSNQFYFYTFLPSIGCLSYFHFINHSSPLVLNIATGSLLVPFTIANVLYYNYQFKKKSSSTFFKIFNFLTIPAVLGAYYLYPLQPVYSAGVLMGANFITSIIQQRTRFKQYDVLNKQSMTPEEIQIENKRYRMGFFMILLRILSMTLCGCILFSCIKLKYVHYELMFMDLDKILGKKDGQPKAS